MIIIKGLWLGFCLYMTIAWVLGIFAAITSQLVIQHLKGMDNKDYSFNIRFVSQAIRLSLAWVLFYFLTFLPNSFSIPHFMGGIKIW
jgi:hypothetical protein